MSDIIHREEREISAIPAFLSEKLRIQYGELAEKIEAGYRIKRPVTLRVNTLKTDADAVKRALRELGVSFECVPWYSDALVLNDVSEREISQTELYRTGEIYLQSLSSMLPPLVLGETAGESVLDMTAAPGGKTTEICALSGGRALVTACEKDKIRFERLRFNVERQGALRVTLLSGDALGLSEFFRFDKILLDAPCSGSGTIESGSKIKISEKLVENSVKMQRALLKKALSLLKTGGTLVYSTCSVLREENEEVVATAKNAELVPIEGYEALPRLPSPEGTLLVCPNGLYEGFFVAKFRKTAE